MKYNFEFNVSQSPSPLLKDGESLIGVRSMIKFKKKQYRYNIAANNEPGDRAMGHKKHENESS